MKKILIQAFKFFGISGIGWLLDFGTYIMLGFISENLAINNFISSYVGGAFVFIFATRKVFQNNSKIALKWKYLIYLVYQLIMIILASKLLNGINLAIVNNINVNFIVDFSAIIAKIVVIPFTMVMNFIVMKGIIEKL